MSRLSDLIEDFIKGLIDEQNDGSVDIQRNELAQYFNCAPSQINYVLTTRFSSDKGYYIESKRGGGGYIKVVKVNINSNRDIRDTILNIIGDSITKARAYSIVDNLVEKSIVSKREGSIIKVSISDRALGIVPQYRNMLRANILKDMLLVLLKE